jgi:hypothetical protein
MDGRYFDGALSREAPPKGVATNLVETGGFDPQDQVERCLRSLRDGYLGSTGECFEIGRTVRTSKRLRRRSPRSPPVPL